MMGVKMGKTKSLIMILFAWLTLEAKKLKADFYDGSRGPSNFQLDQRVNIDKTGEISYAVISKYFGKDLFAAVPISYSNGKISEPSLALGYLVDNLFHAHVKALPVIGAGMNEGKLAGVNPQLYLTWISKDGKITFDPRVQYPIDWETKKGSLEYGGTFGFAVVEDVRIGLDVSKTKDMKPKITAIYRLELTSDHKYWMVTRLNTDGVNVRLQYNF